MRVEYLCPLVGPSLCSGRYSPESSAFYLRIFLDSVSNYYMFTLYIYLKDSYCMMLLVLCSSLQPQLAMLLMTRGADRTRLNFASQLPAQVQSRGYLTIHPPWNALYLCLIPTPLELSVPYTLRGSSFTSNISTFDSCCVVLFHVLLCCFALLCFL